MDPAKLLLEIKEILSTLQHEARRSTKELEEKLQSVERKLDVIEIYIWEIKKEIDRISQIIDNTGFRRGGLSSVKLRGRDLNPRPPGYEPGELPGCSTPRYPNIIIL